MPKINCHEIIKSYVKDNGYDGLYNEYKDCCCTLKDLIPEEWRYSCKDHMLNCKPGYKVPFGNVDEGSCGWFIEGEKKCQK